jgi:hypothetical protein
MARFEIRDTGKSPGMGKAANIHPARSSEFPSAYGTHCEIFPSMGLGLGSLPYKLKGQEARASLNETQNFIFFLPNFLDT